MILLWISIPDLHFIHRRHPRNFVCIRNSFESYRVPPATPTDPHRQHRQNPCAYVRTARQTKIFFACFVF